MAAASPVSQSRILIGLIAGAVAGCGANALFATPAATLGEPPTLPGWLAGVIRYVTTPLGDLFINLLFLPIIPLVFASLALGVTRLGGAGNLGRVGAKTVLYFVITTAIAAAIGLAAVNAIRPGSYLPAGQRDQLRAYYADRTEKQLGQAKPFGVQTFVDIVPRNPLDAFAKKEMLAVIFTSFLVGVALTRIDPDRARLLSEFLEGVNGIAEFVIRLAMLVAPGGVFALIFTTTALFGYQLLVALGAFVGTVLLGLGLQLLVVFPVLVRVLGGMSPVDFFRRIRAVMVTAFSTSSSSATLPTAMQCAETDLRVPPAVSRFVLPLSASMNHNGTALFEGVTALFLAQAFGVAVPLDGQLLILLLCVLTATGMAGVPGGSLPLIGMVVSTGTNGAVAAGAIGIVFGVDRLLDMCRTMVNVTGDMTTVVFVARSEPAAGEPKRTEPVTAPSAPG
jgi:DAACS family dicarboxylate/amino acid:cation (Na+ or H+) symporter